MSKGTCGVDAPIGVERRAPVLVVAMHPLVCSAGRSLEGERLHCVHIFPVKRVCMFSRLHSVCVGHFVSRVAITICRQVRYSTGGVYLGVCRFAVLGKWHCGSLEDAAIPHDDPVAKRSGRCNSSARWRSERGGIYIGRLLLLLLLLLFCNMLFVVARVDFCGCYETKTKQNGSVIVAVAGMQNRHTVTLAMRNRVARGLQGNKCCHTYLSFSDSRQPVVNKLLTCFEPRTSIRCTVGSWIVAGASRHQPNARVVNSFDVSLFSFCRDRFLLAGGVDHHHHI